MFEFFLFLSRVFLDRFHFFSIGLLTKGLFITEAQLMGKKVNMLMQFQVKLSV